MFYGVLEGLNVLRPKQYIKNFLLLAAPFAAGISQFSELGLVLLGILIFSLASSIGYIVNDLTDLKTDRLHPLKIRRPLASGKITVKFAFVLLFLVTALGSILSIRTPLAFNLLVLLYIVNSIFYSLILKRIPVIELFVLSSGFILRLIAGATILSLDISEWFLIVGGFGSVFIVSLKRLSEFKMKNSRTVRSVLGSYSSQFLVSVSLVSMAVTIFGYTIWAFSNSANPFFYQLSVIPFTLGLFLFLWIAEQENVEAPEEIFIKNRTILFLGFLLLILLSIAIY